MTDTIFMDHKELMNFASEIMQRAGCDEKRALITAEVLVEADMREIPSHGVARLGRYVNHIREGFIDPKADPVTLQESLLTVLMDGNAGVGQYVADLAMKEAIAKAEHAGMGFVSVRNSNHYGIAGYFAEKCVQHDMLGVALTNTGAYVVPTYGRRPIMGTNPLAIAFPTATGWPILIDMATSVVPLGKLETYARRNLDIPPGWAVDQTGHSATSPSDVILHLKKSTLGGILALGGEGEAFGGHKGFGLALMIELLTAGLSQGKPSEETYREVGGICHFFGAIKLDLFGDPADITRHFTSIADSIRESEKADQADRIYIHGEKEYEARKRSLSAGVKLGRATYASLAGLAQELGVELLGGN